MYRKKDNIKQRMVILGAFILGVLISSYIKSLSSKSLYISLKDKKEIETNIGIVGSRVNELKSVKQKYEKSLEKYKDALEDDDKSVESVMQEELRELKKSSGYAQVSGKGIIIKVKDSNKDLEDGENPNDLIVHDIDILRILNDLKKAGASAISINGDRVLSNTQIKCSGATITVNETTYGQPFIIRAIGNKDRLREIIDSHDSYASLLKDVYGVEVELKEDNNIVIE